VGVAVWVAFILLLRRPDEGAVGDIVVTAEKRS